MKLLVSDQNTGGDLLLHNSEMQFDRLFYTRDFDYKYFTITWNRGEKQTVTPAVMLSFVEAWRTSLCARSFDKYTFVVFTDVHVSKMNTCVTTLTPALRHYSIYNVRWQTQASGRGYYSPGKGHQDQPNHFVGQAPDQRGRHNLFRSCSLS